MCVAPLLHGSDPITLWGLELTHKFAEKFYAVTLRGPIGPSAPPALPMDLLHDMRSQSVGARPIVALRIVLAPLLHGCGNLTPTPKAFLHLLDDILNDFDCFWRCGNHAFWGYISHPKRNLCIWRMRVSKVIIHHPDDHGYHLAWFSEIITLTVKIYPLAFGKGASVLAHFVAEDLSRHAP